MRSVSISRLRRLMRYMPSTCGWHLCTLRSKAADPPRNARGCSEQWRKHAGEAWRTRATHLLRCARLFERPIRCRRRPSRPNARRTWRPAAGEGAGPVVGSRACHRLALAGPVHERQSASGTNCKTSLLTARRQEWSGRCGRQPASAARLATRCFWLLGETVLGHNGAPTANKNRDCVRRGSTFVVPRTHKYFVGGARPDLIRTQQSRGRAGPQSCETVPVEAARHACGTHIFVRRLMTKPCPEAPAKASTQTQALRNVSGASALKDATNPC